MVNDCDRDMLKGGSMIGLCLNPECNEELRYLRQGSVYAWENGVAPEHSEFFWLCPACPSYLPGGL